MSRADGLKWQVATQRGIAPRNCCATGSRARQGKVRKGEGNSRGGAHAISDIANCAFPRVTSRFETHDLPTYRGKKLM